MHLHFVAYATEDNIRSWVFLPDKPWDIHPCPIFNDDFVKLNDKVWLRNFQHLMLKVQFKEPDRAL